VRDKSSWAKAQLVRKVKEQATTYRQTCGGIVSIRVAILPFLHWSATHQPSQVPGAVLRREPLSNSLTPAMVD
jgi:hypothetical protein